MMLPRGKLQTVPREWMEERKRNRLLTSMESDMPANAPYPGESQEEFIRRMMAQGQGDPRALALAQMMGNPATNPANTMNVGRTTENYLDPMGMDQQQMPADLQEFHSPPASAGTAGRAMDLAQRLTEGPVSRFDVGSGPSAGTRPVEEMAMEEGFGGDASMADAYGGPGAYTEGLPGTEGPPTWMQRRNRKVMLYPDVSDDEFEQQEMLKDYEEQDDNPVRRDTEGELDMVQKNINKTGETATTPEKYEFSGDSEQDARHILELIESGNDPDGASVLEERFKEFYGFDLEGQHEE